MLQPAEPKDIVKTKTTAIYFELLRAILEKKKKKLLGIQRPETQAGDGKAVHPKTKIAQNCVNSTNLERRVSCSFVNYRKKKGELELMW